jgi:putative glutamine amidotransferase
MKNIIVTTRTIKDIKHKEKYYSISHDWINLFNKIKVNPILVTHNSKINSQFIQDNKIQGLILTNGEDVKLNKIKKISGNKRDIFEAKLINLFLKNKLPILGVCRGHQLINNYFGGKLSKKKGHAGTEHKIIIRKSYVRNYLKSNSILVNSYHNYVIKNKNKANYLTCWAELNDTVEGYYNIKFKILTFMWHPERKHQSNLNSLKLIKNHLKL